MASVTLAYTFHMFSAATRQIIALIALWVLVLINIDHLQLYQHNVFVLNMSVCVPQVGRKWL